MAGVSGGLLLLSVLVAVIWILGDMLGLTDRHDDRWDE